MRKNIPDPPASSLESFIALQDTLTQASEHVICALSVASQSVMLNPASPSSKIMRAHLPAEPRTLH